MANKRCFYLVEGQCEKKLVDALKVSPSLVLQGKVNRFNIIQEEIPEKRLMNFPVGSMVILVFDTDKPETEHLKRNIELLKRKGLGIEVKTIAQILNFEDEIERATDVHHAQELTKSQSVSDFKSAVNRMKDAEFRNTLNRHKLDMSKLWIGKPPKEFDFVSQDSDKVKGIKR